MNIQKDLQVFCDLVEKNYSVMALPQFEIIWEDENNPLLGFVLDLLIVIKDRSEFTRHQEKHFIENPKELNNALYSFVMNVDTILGGLIFNGDAPREKETIDPDEIDYMEADEYNGGYYYNKLTGKIIRNKTVSIAEDKI